MSQVNEQVIDLMGALKQSLAKTGADLDRENAQLRAEVERLRGVIEDGAYTIQALSEQLRLAEGRTLVRDTMLNGNEYLSTRVAAARAAIRTEEAL